MKTCNRCTIEKEDKYFGKDKNSKDGLYSICKSCKNQYYIDNKDKITIRHRKYDKVNKHKLSEYRKIWYKENKERQKILRKNRYLNNKEKELNQCKEYRNNNIELTKQRSLCYRNDYALYYTYYDRLTVEESPTLSEDGIYLEVKCRYCGKYFKPTNLQILRRIQTLIGQMNGTNSIYCSDGCKKACPIYRQIKYPKGFRKATSREVQPELRQMVLKRDNYTCQKCEEKDVELHCHHFTGVEQNPIESADLDNCITLCKDCHKGVHKNTGCKYHELRCDEQ
jgi:hypothetical protein